jgi:hypothetical protein
MLRTVGGGFGMLAFAGLFGRSALAADEASPLADRALAATHRPSRARSVIFLYMDGGPSQVDTFDPKPRLVDYNGKPFPMKMAPTQFNNIGNTLASPWKFRQYGESGLPVSDLFPNVAKMADELCVVRSMTSDFSEHTNANYFLHTGAGIPGRPSMGAWSSYGLGSENNDLPGFVVIEGGLIPPGGLDCFSAGFLPARHQGSVMRPTGEAIANAAPRERRRTGRSGSPRRSDCSALTGPARPVLVICSCDASSSQRESSSARAVGTVSAARSSAGAAPAAGGLLAGCGALASPSETRQSTLWRST